MKEDAGSLQRSLLERLKELRCLYGVSDLVERHADDLCAILQGVAELLPISWQYTDAASARITFRGREFTSPTYGPGRRRQQEEIWVRETKAGTIEVRYAEEGVPSGSDPFLEEERLLLRAVAERIGRIAERIDTNRELAAERRALTETNIALRAVLRQVEAEKREIADRVRTNVEKIVLPIVRSIERELSGQDRGYVRLLEQSLREISGSLPNALSREFSSLTSAEIQICNMIKNGLSTKEIAELRSLSVATIKRHRENIRRKLSITGSKVNLQTYLNAYLKTT